ncbi:MAG: ATP-binding protein DrrA1-3 family domain-containing protein, partial [Anaerolineales bacterium]
AGRLLVEGTPAELRNRLEGRVLELRGNPLRLLRRVAEADEDVETALLFGDRLHLRVGQEKSQTVIERLKQVIPQEGGEVTSLHTIPPQLEDIFIALQES